MTQADIEADKALVRAFLETMGRMAPDTLARFCSEDCALRIPSVTMKPDTFAPPQFQRFLDKLAGVLPEGIRFEFVDQISEDGRVATMANGYSRTIDGQAYNNRYHFHHKIAGGRIIEHVEYTDSFLGAKIVGPLLAPKKS